jgi:hypothetical protein
MAVVELKVTADYVFQFVGAAVNAPPQLLFDEARKPALDQTTQKGRRSAVSTDESAKSAATLA